MVIYIDITSYSVSSLRNYNNPYIDSFLSIVGCEVAIYPFHLVNTVSFCVSALLLNDRINVFLSI